MKKIYFLLLFMICIKSMYAQNQSEQLTWVKSMYFGCYYHTGRDANFTWSGGCQNGYCNGYGTIQFYDANGNKEFKYVGYVKDGKNEVYGIQYYPNGYKWYEGNWKNDMRNGYGTSYNEDGSIEFQGNFINDEFEYLDFKSTLALKIGKYVMQNIFDGGTHLETELVEWTDNEVRIKIEFNGNIVRTNRYVMTLILKNTAPFVDFVNYNENADVYLRIKLTATIAQGISDLLKDSEDK